MRIIRRADFLGPDRGHLPGPAAAAGPPRIKRADVNAIDVGRRNGQCQVVRRLPAVVVVGFVQDVWFRKIERRRIVEVGWTRIAIGAPGKGVAPIVGTVEPDGEPVARRVEGVQSGRGSGRYGKTDTGTSWALRQPAGERRRPGPSGIHGSIDLRCR